MFFVFNSLFLCADFNSDKQASFIILGKKTSERLYFRLTVLQKAEYRFKF